MVTTIGGYYGEKPASENQIKKLFEEHDPEKVERHNDGESLIFEMRKKGQPRGVFRYTKPSGGVT